MQTPSNEVWPRARVIRQPIDEKALVGTLFQPNTPDPHPAVVLLGGSDGTLMEGTAAVLASEGYAALALAYFGMDPLPRELAEIPLEYFERAISWLRAQPTVQSGRVAVMGVSKGGELAMLLGATYPEHVGAVVGYSASSIVWRGGPYGPQSLFATPRSSWMLRGDPLPFVDPKPRLSEILGPFVGKFPDTRAIHQRALEDKDTVTSATIRVEKIDGPVLLISHADDRLWPATRLSEMVSRVTSGLRSSLSLRAPVLRGCGPSRRPPLLRASHGQDGPLVSGRQPRR